MQKRRYGEKRTGGYVDMGKQVRERIFGVGPRGLTRYLGVVFCRIYPQNTYEK